MSTATILIGPEHHGQRISLEDFKTAEAREGHLYELSRGVVTVIDVPGRHHRLQINAIRRQFSTFEVSHLDEIYCIAGGNECKISVEAPVSERHPDLAIYKMAPPAEEESSDI